ncbi:type II toxin-antitoxin system RelE family toxin [Hydrogenimonas sp.]
MASYSIEIKKSAYKETRKLPKATIAPIVEAIGKLADDPRPPGCKKLTGEEKYRLHVGTYRILYTIEDQKLVVYVVRVAHRKDVYR